MYPRLDFGAVAIDSYWALLMVGIAVGSVAALRLALAARLSVRHFTVLIAGAVLAGLLGSHWLQVCVEWDRYQSRPLAILEFWKGRAFIGGPIAGLAFVVGYALWQKLPGWRSLDCLAPGLAIGHFFGRLGCCACGCCHGCPTDTWLGVTFTSTAVDPAAWRGVPLHPTQLYEAAGLLAIFYCLLWLWRRRSYDGQVVLAYFLTYALLRFSVEFLRGDAIRGFVIGWLSTSQFVAALMFTGALAALVLRLWHPRRAGVAEAVSLPATALAIAATPGGSHGPTDCTSLCA